MHILVGLGNPGSKYARNRHNIGFMAVDEIHGRHSFSPWRRKFSAEVADGTIGGAKTLLVKPQTYMNLSGQSVGEAMRFYKLTPQDITVLHDELDLAPGKVRIKKGGGNGGHNGLKSTDQHIGKDYFRARLGIGHPGDKARVNGHVLGDFAKADEAWLEPLLDAIGREAGLLVASDGPGFMNKMALALKPDSSEAPAKAPKPRNEASPPPKQEKSSEVPKKGALADGLKKLFGME